MHIMVCCSTGSMTTDACMCEGAPSMGYEPLSPGGNSGIAFLAMNVTTLSSVLALLGPFRKCMRKISVLQPPQLVPQLCIHNYLGGTGRHIN